MAHTDLRDAFNANTTLKATGGKADMSIALECFLLSVRERRKKQLLPLDNFDGAGASVIGIVAQAIEPLKKKFHVDGLALRNLASAR